MHSFKSKPTNKSVMSPIKFILLALVVLNTSGNTSSVVLNTSGNTSIGLNCSFPNTMDPPAGFQFVLKSCPSQVHFNARYLCRIPDLSRCDLSCPGQCSKNDSTVEYCIISWTCHWKLIQDTNPTTTTLRPPKSETGLSKTWIAIITSIIILVSVAVIFFLWYFLKKRYRPLREEEAVSYHHTECEEITFNCRRSIISLAQCLRSPNENYENNCA